MGRGTIFDPLKVSESFSFQHVWACAKTRVFVVRAICVPATEEGQNDWAAISCRLDSSRFVEQIVLPLCAGAATVSTMTCPYKNKQLTVSTICTTKGRQRLVTAHQSQTGFGSAATHTHHVNQLTKHRNTAQHTDTSQPPYP